MLINVTQILSTVFITIDCTEQSKESLPQNDAVYNNHLIDKRKRLKKEEKHNIWHKNYFSGHQISGFSLQSFVNSVLTFSLPSLKTYIRKVQPHNVMYGT